MGNEIQAVSAASAGAVAGIAPSVVGVHSHRMQGSGFVWRSGLIVTSDDGPAVVIADMRDLVSEDRRGFLCRHPSKQTFREGDDRVIRASQRIAEIQSAKTSRSGLPPPED